MKKVGIVTMVSVNYGNRLQNYALQQALRGQGCVVTISNRNKKLTGENAGLKQLVQNTMQTKTAILRQVDSHIDISEIAIGWDDYLEDFEKKCWDCFESNVIVGIGYMEYSRLRDWRNAEL